MPAQSKSQIKRRPGRPVSVGKGVTLTIYVPREVAAIAMRNSQTLSEFVRLAIGEKMERGKAKKEK